MLGRRFPEPFIALLAFILGIWMWDRYFLVGAEYAPGTESLALRKIDRDLRLADAMERDPAWLRWVAGAGRPEEVQKEALEVLGKLEAAEALGPEGIEAHPVILAALHGRELDRPSLRVGDEGFGDPPAMAWAGGSWWRAQVLEARQETGISGWEGFYESSLETLRRRAILSGVGMAVFALGGLVFLPRVFGGFSAALTDRPRGYASRWTPAMGLTVFFVGTLAWIGYVSAINLGIETVKSLPVVMALLLDTAARFLTPLLVVGFLFKQPSHAIRVLGLDRPVDVRLVLGGFCLLVLAEAMLQAVLGKIGSGEPAGGLSLADAGKDGLWFAVVSACLVAPVAEEILFRGVLFRSLRNGIGVVPAAAVSAVIFSAVHFNGVHGFLSVAFFGFVAAMLYAGTGSLSVVIVLHSLYNVSVKIPSWVFYHAGLEW